MTRHISSREFARDLKAAKQAAETGPVIITTRGKPEYALLRYDAYQRLTGGAPGQSLWDLMSAMPAAPDVEFDPARLDLRLRDTDFGLET